MKLTVRRPLMQKLYASQRVAMLIDYLNHEKLSVLQSKYNIDMTAPSSMLHRYGIRPNPIMGRRRGNRIKTQRDWLIVFIASEDKEIQMLRALKK